LGGGGRGKQKGLAALRLQLCTAPRYVERLGFLSETVAAKAFPQHPYFQIQNKLQKSWETGQTSEGRKGGENGRSTGLTHHARLPPLCPSRSTQRTLWGGEKDWTTTSERRRKEEKTVKPSHTTGKGLRAEEHPTSTSTPKDPSGMKKKGVSDEEGRRKQRKKSSLLTVGVKRKKTVKSFSGEKPTKKKPKKEGDRGHFCEQTLKRC